MIEEYKEMSMQILLFFRPLSSKLYRVVGLPDNQDNLTELDQVLNTICLTKKAGVWYFKKDHWEDIARILCEMNVPNYFIEPDEVFLN